MQENSALMMRDMKEMSHLYIIVTASFGLFEVKTRLCSTLKSEVGIFCRLNRAFCEY